MSISGYRAWKHGGRRSHRRLTDTQLLELIRTIHAQFKGAYGSPRMVDELRGRGFPAAKARVERLMRDAKITQIWEGTNQVHRQLIGRSFARK